jgi:hypothetical protein
MTSVSRADESDGHHDAVIPGHSSIIASPPPQSFGDGDGIVYVHVDRERHSQGFTAGRRFNNSARENVCLSRSASAISTETCIIATSSSKWS